MKLTKAQETTLRTIASQGGEMDGYIGQAGLYVKSLRPLHRAGLLMRVEGGYYRHRITEAGWDYLGR